VNGATWIRPGSPDDCIREAVFHRPTAQVEEDPPVPDDAAYHRSASYWWSGRVLVRVIIIGPRTPFGSRAFDRGRQPRSTAARQHHR
jgi:hypothetical protein